MAWSFMIVSFSFRTEVPGFLSNRFTCSATCGKVGRFGISSN